MEYEDRVLAAFQRDPAYRNVTTVKVLFDVLVQRHLLAPLGLSLESEAGQSLREKVSQLFERDFRRHSQPGNGNRRPEAYVTRIGQYLALRTRPAPAPVQEPFAPTTSAASLVDELLAGLEGLAWQDGDQPVRCAKPSKLID